MNVFYCTNKLKNKTVARSQKNVYMTHDRKLVIAL